MAVIALVFTSVLVVTFAVLTLFTRPSAAARTIQGRVGKISAVETLGPEWEGVSPELIKQIQLSNIDWLNDLLQRWRLAHNLKQLISQAESSWSVPMLAGISAACGIAGFAISYMSLPEPAVCAAVSILFMALPIFWLQFKRGRRVRRFSQGLPDAVDLIIRALRAGHSVSAAIEIVSQEAEEPVRSEFREVYTQENFGLPHREALLQLAKRVPSADLRFVVTAMLVQKETGGNLVDILERTATVIRERLRIEGEVRIYTAQGRLTGVILSLLPLIMFFLINLANPGYSRILLDDPLGRKMVYTGAAAMIVGGMLIRKIVKVKV